MRVNIPADINFETSMFWVAINAGIMDKKHKVTTHEGMKSNNQRMRSISLSQLGNWETRMLEY